MALLIRVYDDEIDGERILASHWNDELNNIINNFKPSYMDDISPTDVAMQTAVNPAGLNKAEDLAGELTRLRWMVASLSGETYWYEAPQTNFKNITERVYNYAAATGAANTYAVTLSPAPLAIAAGMTFWFKASATNTGASTINPNSLGTEDIKMIDGSALVGNEILEDGIYCVTYDGTNFLLIGHNVRASDAEAIAGTEDENVITPATMRAGFNADGTAPVYAVRAWLRFSVTLGTPSIDESGNVASITDLGVGFYRINFTTELEDANYAVVSISADRDADGTEPNNSFVNGTPGGDPPGLPTTAKFELIYVLPGTGTLTEATVGYVAVIR